MNFKIKYIFWLNLFFILACQQKETLFSKLNYNKDISKILIIVYNNDNTCISCNLALQNFFLDIRTNQNFTNGIVTVLKAVREKEKGKIEKQLIEFGVHSKFIYDNNLFNELSQYFSDVPSAGGFIVLDNKDNLLFELSFKSPYFSEKIQSIFDK